MDKLVAEKLWDEFKDVLPERKRSPKGGRPAVDNRRALIGIVFVLRTGIPWNMLPPELGCGSGVTCWRRMQEWTNAGVWPAMHAKLLRLLGRKGKLKASRVIVDSASVRANFGGSTPAPIRRIEGKKAVNGIC